MDKDRNTFTSNELPHEDDPMESIDSDLNRRRFIKASLATAPVILTLRSRPVWAKNCSESGLQSGNLSREPCVGNEGCSPGFWKNQGRSSWHPDYPHALEFRVVFNIFDSYNPFVNQSITLIDLIDHNVTLKSGYHNLNISLGRHAVAALQNAATRVDYPYSVSEVKNMVENAYNHDPTASGHNDLLENTKDLFDIYNGVSCPL